ncbi:adhesion G-protein coupled receptor G6 [Chiloscyllium plagiosum]|uniref:adhesion G-protein coupled receptor G6 n=1 Tax=Chiloscyllium plagiosum TaxID=36176 RepID=UPI001CB83C35|nr:adhesion G-protein coupled receptor G6 [Chiloscyllium plagiosum]
MSSRWRFHQGWSFWNFLCHLAIFTICLDCTAVLGCSKCTETLTGPTGQFTSPCFPREYVSDLSCKWTIRAPPGFIIQLTFHEFELEEAQRCLYDLVSINTGAELIEFCGVTAKGLTLNSTGNQMIVTFKTDFSIQKKGFRVSYKQVAVSLRNQMLVLSKTSQKHAVAVSPSITIPELRQFTICLEVRGAKEEEKWTLFSYTDSSDTAQIRFKKEGDDIHLEVSDVECNISELWIKHFSEEVITDTWRELCLAWNGTSGNIISQMQDKYQLNPCPASQNKVIAGSGTLSLAPKVTPTRNTYTGDLYNVRLWNFSMSSQSLLDLTCDEKGNVVDWENSFWDIPVGVLEPNSDLSCATASPTQMTIKPTYCSTPGSGCQVTTPSHFSTSITNTHGTNSPEPSTAGTNPPLSEITSPGTTEPAAPRGLLYMTQFTVHDEIGDMNIADLEQRISNWVSTLSWPFLSSSAANGPPCSFCVSVIASSVRPPSITPSLLIWILQNNKTVPRRISRSIDSTSYECVAILYYNITKNVYLEERIVQERLRNTSSGIGNNLSIESIQVQPVVNCSSEEKPAQYIWKAARPRTTQYLSCIANQEQYASRSCLLNMQNYTSFWEPPDLRNCSLVTNNSTLENLPPVSADNAAEVASQLLDFSADGNLTQDQVVKLVETLNQIVIVSDINSTLASTVLSVLSNILSSSDEALATSSQVALRTLDALTVKMIFSGSSVSISKRNVAIGISAVNSTNYTGTSFTVGSQNGDSELEPNFNGDPHGEALAGITLPPGLFEHLTADELSMVSRIQFAFFSKTGLFQEDVRPQCAFWDLTLKNGSGGWNIQGCQVDSDSSVNETICLCDHLTHFGVLLDISGTAPQIDPLNTKILTFITHIGCGISAIFSATTLLTYVAFEKLRRDYPSKILMNLSTALFLLNLTFLLDGWIASFNIPGLCIAVAAFLHFFLLASFTWMGLEAVHMYIALVKVFNTYIRKYMLKFCIIGWGLPAIVVAIVLAIDEEFYGVKPYGEDSENGGSEFCWIIDRIAFYISCVSYFVIVFLVNVAMFIVVLMQICGRSGKKSHRNLKEEALRNLRSVISLTFLLGMTWGFAFFAWGPVNLAFMYLFAIFNSLQGFFIFMFHCALKENVQKQWRRYLCCGRFRLPENSDWSRTITNNTKKVSSENLGKSLSSSSIGSNSTSWTSKFKSGSSFFKNSSKGGLFAAVTSSKFDHLDAHQDPVFPTHNVLDKVTSQYPTHSDNFYKNIMMSDSFSHSTKF